MSIGHRKSITIFYPSKNIGGAQLLFARVARYFADVFNYKVNVVDYENGYVNKYLQNENVAFEFYDFEQPLPIYIEEDTCLLIAASYFPRIKYYFRFKNPQTSSVFLWVIHPHNVLAYSLFTNIYVRIPVKFGAYLIRILEPLNQKRVSRFIEKASNNNAFVFMDQKTFDYAIHYYNRLNITPKFLPIPVKVCHSNRTLTRAKNTRKIRIGWMSRLYPDKVYALKCLIINISQYRNGFSEADISLYIIGDGVSRSEIDTLCSHLMLDYQIVGNVPNNQISAFLSAHIDLLFATGTSLLEAASLKIPAAMVSGSNYKFPDPKSYKYIWLFENYNYSLGLSDRDSQRFKSFNDIINDYIKGYETIASKCYEYCFENHSYESICRKLQNLIESNTLNVNAAESMFLSGKFRFKIIAKLQKYLKKSTEVLNSTSLK